MEFYQLFAVFVSLCLRHLHWRNVNGAEGIFGFYQTRVGCSPVHGPTLKKALYHTCLVVGQRINKIQHGIIFGVRVGKFIAGWSIKVNNRFDAERLPKLRIWPGHFRASEESLTNIALELSV